MADLKALSDEMAKLKRQFETVLYISGYCENSDLSGLSDYTPLYNFSIKKCHTGLSDV